MTKLNALLQTNEIQTRVDAMCEAQDAATMQIVTIARMARLALDGDMDDAANNAGHALDAIMQIAAAANAKLDAAQIEISDARICDAAAREGAVRSASPFGHVTPI